MLWLGHVSVLLLTLGSGDGLNSVAYLNFWCWLSEV